MTWGDHMMTMKVYEVSRDGRIRVLRPTSEVVPLEVVEPCHDFPACECPQHRPPGTDAAYRTYLAHTHLCATCRAGVSCPTAARLGRAWRQTR